MAKTAKNKAPSRVRYEQTHPTVSCRVSREVYSVLQKVKVAEGKSFADILKVGLDIIEAKTREEGEIRKKSYTEGYQKGYSNAECKYKITYPCSVCGEAIELSSREAKQAVSEYMQEHGWGHRACHERKQ